MATLVAGPINTTLATNSCTFKRRRRNHHNHSSLAQINCVSDLHQTTTAILILLGARQMLALLLINLQYLLITSIDVMLNYFLKLKPCYRITTL